MRKLYSINAPYKSFKEQITVNPKKEFDIGYGDFAESINNLSDVESYRKNRIIHHRSLLNQLYAKSQSILVLGAGDGIQALDFISKYHPNKDIILSDISIKALEKVRKSIPVFEVREINALAIDMPSNHFDLVYGQGMEYVFNDNNYKKLISEMCRVTKHGMTFVLTTLQIIKPEDIGLIKRLLYFISNFPYIYIYIIKFFKKRNLKWTGYVRSFDEHLRVILSVKGFKLERIEFEWDQNIDRLISTAFIFNKL